MLRLTFLVHAIIYLSLLNFSDTQAQVSSNRPPGHLYSYQSNKTQGKDCPGPGPPQPLPPRQDTVVFYTNLSHPHQNRVFVECDLVRFGEATLLPNHANVTFELKELNLPQHQSDRNPWMSCRFAILFTNVLRNSYFADYILYTPPRQPYKSFDPYYNVSLSGTRGSGNVTRIFLNDTGIFVGKQLISQWGLANQSQISSEPGFKLLNAQDVCLCAGANCEGTCAVMKIDQGPVCVVHSDYFSPHFSNCTPRSDYDIKKYAYDQIVTATGMPCLSKCKVTEGGFMCSVRISHMYLPLHGQVCSPSPGLTYLSEECTGPCTFNNNTYMTCPTFNNPSRRELCSASPSKHEI